MLRNGDGVSLAFQQVRSPPEPTWPEGPRPQMLHLDTSVPTFDACRCSINGRVVSEHACSSIDPMIRSSHCSCTPIWQVTRLHLRGSPLTADGRWKQSSGYFGVCCG